MKNDSWFRVYNRMIDSPEILELSDTEFRLLVSLWCLASSQEERGMVPFSPRALQRRVLPTQTIDEIQAMLNHLIELGLLETVEHGYAVANWTRHQYTYNSLAPEARREQKAKERAAKKTMSQECRNDVASIDTEEEGDTETEKEPEKTMNYEGGANGLSPEGAIAPRVDEINLLALADYAGLPHSALDGMQRTIIKFMARAPDDDPFEQVARMKSWLANPKQNTKKRTMSYQFFANWLEKATKEPTYVSSRNPQAKPKFESGSLEAWRAAEAAGILTG